MQTYKEFRPSLFDCAGLCEDEVGAESLVMPTTRNRDSGVLANTNFEEALKRLGGESDSVAVHRFGHWACGWFEIIVVTPGTAAAKIAENIEKALDNYPVLNDDAYETALHEEAARVWRECYDPAERVEYIRAHESDFEFHGFADMLGCVRGNYFAGDDMSLVEDW